MGECFVSLSHLHARVIIHAGITLTGSGRVNVAALVPTPGKAHTLWPHQASQVLGNWVEHQGLSLLVVLPTPRVELPGFIGVSVLVYVCNLSIHPGAKAPGDRSCSLMLPLKSFCGLCVCTVSRRFSRGSGPPFVTHPEGDSGVWCFWKFRNLCRGSD